MKKILRLVFSKRFLVAITAVIQLAIMYILCTKLYGLGGGIYIAVTFIGLLCMLYLLENDNINPTYKLFWMLIMLFLPVSGVALYLLYGRTILIGAYKSNLISSFDRYKKELKPNKEVCDEITAMDKDLGKQATYLQQIACAPPFKDTRAKYYSMGADLFHDYLQDIKKAKKSIFIQYFIIDEGFLWDQILEILKEKVKNGVDVRIIYDAFGCMITLPANYDKILESYGIKACIFNDLKFSRHLGDYLMFNHRDHRKITVIDSNIGYGGGVNLADEYANIIERFGVWKDTGFRLEGQGVWSMTCTFLQNWEACSGKITNYDCFHPTVSMPSDTIVQHYHDVPMDRYNISENVYLTIINNANNYVYMATPYLVIDNEILTALTLAAESGIDVRLIVPGIPDKWYVYYVTQSYYKVLLEAGVKIYEYTPGFIHAKMYVSDDNVAVVGSANMDYRSLHLHFENCCSFYGGKIVGDVKSDFEDMFSYCHMVTEEDVKSVKLYKRVMQIALRILGPMM